MTFDTIKRQSGRVYCEIFEIDLDVNDPLYEADFAAEPLSYGTPKTTIDVRAYKEGEVRTYRYCNQYISNLDCFPSGVERQPRPIPPKANPGIDIGFRASASVNLKDFISNDAYELQGLYADRRVVGSHFAKLFARNYIKNRPARVRRGYLVNGAYDADNFQTEHYIVDEYQNPTLSGDVSFSLVDVLALTNAINAKLPEVTNTTINAALTTGSTSMSLNTESGLTSSQIEELFGANGETGFAAIGSEFVGYTITSATGVSPITMNITRGEFGTVVAEHEINASVQRCLAWSAPTNIIDIITEILSQTDIDQTYIPTAEWAALKAGALSTVELVNVIYKPTEVKKMLNELIQVAGLTMYVDVVEKAIKIIASGVFDEAVIVIDQVEHIEVNSLKITNKFDRLTTRQLVQWAPIDYSKTEETNFAKSFRVADLIEEGKGRLAAKNEGSPVQSRWLPNTTNGNQIATAIAQREVARFRQIPAEVSFDIDTKYVGNLSTGGRLWLGATFQIVTPERIFCDGGFNQRVLTCQCTSIAAGSKSDKWKVTGISYISNAIPENVDYTIEAGYYLDYVLSSEFSFTEAREYVVVINQGAVFGSTSTATPSFSQGTFPVGASLRIINQGQIIGKGGLGGEGASPVYDSELLACTDLLGFTGSPGGPGFEATTDVSIDNAFGLIASGGSGGKGGNGLCIGPKTYAGGGGGGGQGSEGGAGGLAGSGLVSGAGNGLVGTINTGGNGGLGASDADGAASAGAKGNAIGTNTAIITNGNTVTITAGNNSEQIKGAIV